MFSSLHKINSKIKEEIYKSSVSAVACIIDESSIYILSIYSSSVNFSGKLIEGIYPWLQLTKQE